MSTGYKFDHIAIGVWSIRDAIPFYEDELGGEPLGGSQGLTFSSAQWAFANGAKLEALDPPTYMEPDALQSNFMHSFLSSGGPRVHHVTFKVPNLDDAIARARDNGWKVVGVNKELPSWHEAFIHPKQDGVGIVVQLAEAHPEKEPEWLLNLIEDPTWLRSMGSSYKLPLYEYEPFVSIVGLHLNVHLRNKEAAFRLWRDTLKGTQREISPSLVAFSWKESPMQIFLHTNDTADEGVLFIEIEQARPWKRIPSSLLLTQRTPAGNLPSPHPLLGAIFVLNPSYKSCAL